MVYGRAVTPHPTDRIIGATRPIAELRRQIRRLASFDTAGRGSAPTVLLTGETGTGKGLVARVLHDSGGRARGPFVDVNCAAIPESMLEAELFGFEAGAFTDAKRPKRGLFEAAGGGTLFLDEIDALTPGCQSKLLKAIEEKSVRRLGAVEPRQIDVKLIAATQRDLPDLVAAGQFRGDLYHRLAVVVLSLPALRAHPEDVVPLAEEFLRTYATAHRVDPKALTDETRRWLAAETWPGNVRELSHLMERATLLATADVLSPAALAELRAPAIPTRSAMPFTSALPGAADAAPSSDEAMRIRRALERAGGNVVGAARLLGLGRNALRYRMRRLGIERPSLGELAASAEPTAPVAESSRPDAPPSFEEKPVAVLALELAFAGSDAETGVFDPWTRAQRWEAMIDERIAGFGGLVIGRGPTRRTVVYGIPRAVEQLADRALQTALALRRLVVERRDLGPVPELRAAIHAGAVQVDVAAADPAARLLGVGDSLVLADRLLGHAGRDEILLSPAAARRVREGHPLRSRSARVGVEDHERLDAFVYPASGERGSAPIASDTPFVGRTRELALLRDAFASATAGAGQVAFVVGDAGIGKSRVLRELRRSLGDASARWIEGHCAAYGAATPFLPIVDGLRRFFAIDDRDDERAAADKVARAVTALAGDLEWTLPFLRQILSLAPGDERIATLDSASRRSETFAALKALVHALAEREPLVAVVEDLHWIDPASEEFLGFLGESIPTARVLLVCSHRPGYQHSFGDRSYHVRVAVPPLSPTESDDMTSALLSDKALPAEVRKLIGQKAEGNPFFVEEVVSSLLQDGTLRREGDRIAVAGPLTTASVPDRIHDVLAARLDRLEAEAKRAIQIASVIGREFVMRLLERIAEAGAHVRTEVEALRSLELIYEKSLHPELAYMFKHALTHEVAYESVAVARRQALHRTIGTTIEQLYADRLSEHYETLAHHFATGEDWERALTYHVKAAIKAEESFANRAVIAHCRAALAVADRSPTALPTAERAELEERLGLALFHVSEYAASAAAYERASALRDAALHVVDLGRASLSHFWAHHYEDARRTRDRARTMAQAAGMHAAEGLAITLGGFAVAVIDGAFADADVCHGEALDLARRSGNEEVESLVLGNLGESLEWQGRYAEAITALERAVALGRKLRLAHLIVMPTWFCGKARCCLGDYDRAVPDLRAAYDVCDRIGDRAWKGRLLNTLGWLYAELGDWGRAREHDEAAVRVAREIDDLEIIANAEINLGGTHLALGDAERALAYLEPIEAALAVPDPWMRWRFALHTRDLRARLELRRGDPTAALQNADEELAGARRHRAAKLEARAGVTRGRALAALERWDAADAGLVEAFAVAERIGYRRAAWQALQVRAVVARRRGDRAAADHNAAAASQVVERVATALADPELARRVRATAAHDASLV